jgi:hypothetical protein
MSDLQDIRAQLRDGLRRPAVSSDGSGGLGFWVITAGAVAVGFGIVMFAPRIYTMQRTASLPSFQQVASQVEQVPPRAPVATSPEPVNNPARYIGKDADEIGKIADAFCAPQSSSQLLGGPGNPMAARRADAEKIQFDFATGGDFPDVNDRLHCRLTEATPRYCSRSQRQKITADVINYFKGIEYMNTSMHVVAKVQATIGPDAGRTPREAVSRLGNFTVDPRVIEGVEGLLRAGYLLKPQREDIQANVPRPVKERFLRVVSNKAPCPDPPWWQIWK